MPDYAVGNTIYPEVEIIPATAASIENAYQGSDMSLIGQQ